MSKKKKTKANSNDQDKASSQKGTGALTFAKALEKIVKGGNKDVKKT